MPDKALIGTIHLLPTPSSPAWDGALDKIYETAVNQAKIFMDNNIDALIVENTFDTPYEQAPIHPATVSAMSVAIEKIKKHVDCPLGVQILAGGNIEALSLAISLELDFIRVEGFAFCHIADEGFFNASGPNLLRCKNYLKNENTRIFADIKKKHSSHKITEDISPLEMAKAVEFMRADGVILTGDITGEPPSLKHLKNIKGNVHIPVLIGSGITYENFSLYLDLADYFIVGSYFKKDNNWQNELIPSKIRKLIKLKEKYTNKS